MTNDAHHFNTIFSEAVSDYHTPGEIEERISRPPGNPYPEDTLEHLLYRKCRIDNIQWDLEDLIRDPAISPEKALQLKRLIDKSNQDRTDTVEQIDDVFVQKYKEVQPAAGARLNTESIAWALDRLSILALKIYHMDLQVRRKEVSESHRERCRSRLRILQEQQADLVRAIDELIADVKAGKRVIKVYRQMKMYNDPSLNPVLYGQKDKA